jgi:glutaredoxin
LPDTLGGRHAWTMKKLALIVLFAGAVYYQFFAGQPVGVYTDDGAPKTVLFTTAQCGNACDETRKYLLRRKIDFEEHDAFDQGAGSKLFKEYGGTGYMPLIAMGHQRVIGHNPGGIISALAIEFGPGHIKSREVSALQRNFDDANDPRVVMYATAWCGYCKKARQYFTDNDIEFVEYDIEKDRAAKRDYDGLRVRYVPVLDAVPSLDGASMK